MSGTAPGRHPNLTIAECFGLSPWRVRVGEALLTVRGDPHTPKSRADLTSIRLLQPSLSFPLWLGRHPKDRLSPIYNFYSHAQPDPALGWSVQIRAARDFRGLQATYDSHNGTDFAVPPGTPIVAAAPGRVLRISNEFHRGGLKVFLDHGAGLFTSYNHLARSTVGLGDRLGRGQVLGLSGASGLDGFLFFPWSTPHVHFNVWLGGLYVDPFARAGEAPLWRTGENDPRPHRNGAQPEEAAPTRWNADAIDEIVAHCLHEGAKADILSGPDLATRGMNAHFQLSYFPTRFARRPSIVADVGERRRHLDLPLSAADYDGVRFPSEARSVVRPGG